MLVVDDSASNRTILEEALKTWGLKTGVAGSGSEALRELHEAAGQGRSYQLMLADGHMPGMDGFDLVQQMRRSPDLAAATVMMLTSDDYYSSVRRCSQMGVTAHLIKPVRLVRIAGGNPANGLAGHAAKTQHPASGSRNSLPGHSVSSWLKTTW